MTNSPPAIDEIFFQALQCGSKAERDVRPSGEPPVEATHSCGPALRTLLKAYPEAGSFLEAPAAATDPTLNHSPCREARHDHRPLQAPRTDRRGRHGHGLHGPADRTHQARGRAQNHQAGHGLQGRARPLRGRAAGPGPDGPPQHRPVLDAGSDRPGRPFFVMELVKGMPITEYCDGQQAHPAQRLELFVPVCQAIQHAHQKGIIHRDIKPSNVLVTLYDDKPVPKVIDFGVAKATGQGLTEKTLLTGFGALVGTPEYMSPEQANLDNLDIDTRSDVYSLGVLLYELLTGSTPLDRKSLGAAAILEVLRIVREVESPRPSVKLGSSDTLPSIAANRNTGTGQAHEALAGRTRLGALEGPGKGPHKAL